VALFTTTRIGVPLLARSLPAVIAAFLAAVAPDRIGDNLQSLDRRNRVVTGDDEVTGSRAFFRGFVTYDNGQARTRMQRCWERIVNRFPMAVRAFERDARNVQLTVAHVADRNRTLLPAACPHAAEERRAGDSQLAGRRIARDLDRPRAARIVTVHRDEGSGWCGAKTGRLKPDWQRYGIPGPNGNGVGQYGGNQEVTGGGSEMLFTKRVHLPPLFTTRGSSTNEPTHTLPKLPLSAIPRTSRGATAVPVTVIVCGLNRS